MAARSCGQWPAGDFTSGLNKLLPLSQAHVRCWRTRPPLAHSGGRKESGVRMQNSECRIQNAALGTFSNLLFLGTSCFSGRPLARLFDTGKRGLLAANVHRTHAPTTVSGMPWLAQTTPPIEERSSSLARA